MPLNALYIDPDLSTRLRFKQAARTTGMLGSLVAINTLLEGLERLETRKAYDVIYLASRFTTEVVSNFIKAARRSLQGEKSVYMVVLERQECDPTTLAGFAMAGVDGFLVAPFSTESLAENVAIATRILTVKTRKHNELSLELLVKAVIVNFSNYVKSIKASSPTVVPRDQLRRTHSLIEGLAPDLRETYFSLLIERFARATPAVPAINRKAGFMPFRTSDGAVGSGRR